MATTIYVSIGNTDNRLTQQEWATFYRRVDRLIVEAVTNLDATMYGRWVSPSTDEHQNACWAFSEPEVEGWSEGQRTHRDRLRSHLSLVASDFGQDSIAWAEAEVDFLPGHTPGATARGGIRP